MSEVVSIGSSSRKRLIIGGKKSLMNNHFVEMNEELLPESLKALQSSHNWVKWFLDYNSKYITFDNDMIQIEGTSPDANPFDEIYIAYQQHYADFAELHTNFRLRERIPARMTFADIKRAIEKAESDNKAKVMADLIKQITYKPNVKFDIVEALKTLNPGSEEDLELAARALTHLIVNIKRRMQGLPTTSELMFILFSTTNGTGKSLFIKRLGEVFGVMFEGGLGLSLFSSKFDRHIMTSKFLIEIDELKGATNSDMTEIKSCITGSTARVEKKGKDSVTRRLVASFIGSSNHDIKNVLFDTTGMRRFYQFHVGEQSLTESQATPIKSIDFLSMVQSVNEFDYSYVSQLTTDLKTAQDGYKSLTQTEEFLRDLGIGAAPLSDYKDWVSSTYTTPVALYKMFREYSVEMGKSKIIAKDKFEAQLKILGYEASKKTVPQGHFQYKRPAVGDVCRKKNALCLPIGDLKSAYASAVSSELEDEHPIYNKNLNINLEELF